MQNLKKNWLVVWKMTWEISQIFTTSYDSLKIETLMVSFCLKLKMYELKNYRGVVRHGKEEWCTNWIGIDCQFKIDMRNLKNFIWALKNLKSLQFNGLLLTKVCNVWAKKIQRIYVWWYWMLVQNLKEKWLGHSKVKCHDIFQLKNKAQHFSSSSFFFFFLWIFLKIISQFCISQWSVRRKVFDKLLWLFQLAVFVIFAIYLASICILLPPLFTDLLVRNSF